MSQHIRFKRAFATFQNAKQRDAFLAELNELCVKYERLSKANYINYDFDFE